MTSKLSRRQRRATKRMSHIVRFPVSQCQGVAVYLAAYMRVFVRPRLRLNQKNRRSNLFIHNLIARLYAMAGGLTLFVSFSWLHDARRYWKSLYYLHGADPYPL